MQQMRLYIFSGRRSEETFENTHWKKANHMYVTNVTFRAGIFRTQLSRYTERLGFFLFPVRQFINRFSKVVVVATQLNILWGSLLCCQHKLSSCICRTGNRIAAEEQLQFQFLVGIAAEEIVRQLKVKQMQLM